MFIKNSFADEIARNMAERLDEEKVSQATARERNLVQAADYLNSVAEIYEELGMYKASEAVTRIMEVTASQEQKVHETTESLTTKTPGEDKKNLKTKPSGQKVRDVNHAFDMNDGRDDRLHQQYADDKNCAMCGSEKSDSNMAFDDAVRALYSGDEDEDYEDEDDFTHRFSGNSELDQEI